jgi:hypothetical protein
VLYRYFIADVVMAMPLGLLVEIFLFGCRESTDDTLL